VVLFLGHTPEEAAMHTTDRPVRPKLALNTFGIAFGTAGLAGTWTAAGADLHAPAAIGEVLWVAAALLWIGTIVRYVRRAGGVRGIRDDLRHPVFGPFAALVPAVASLLSAHLATWLPTAGAVGVWVAAAVSTAFGAWFVASLVTVPREAGTLHGGYLLPTVAASLLTAQSFAVIGEHTLAAGFFAAGILFWVLIGAVLISRLTTGPALPAPLFPTVAILSAPPAVAGNAWWTITGGAPSTVQVALVGTMVAFLLPHLFLVRRYLRTGFAVGFWAMTFTAAASATYGVRVLSAGDLGTTGVVLAWVVVALATGLVGVIAIRSVGLLRRR
jgi:tellurite resistance protein